MMAVCLCHLLGPPNRSNSENTRLTTVCLWSGTLSATCECCKPPWKDCTQIAGLWQDIFCMTNSKGWTVSCVNLSRRGHKDRDEHVARSEAPHRWPGGGGLSPQEGTPRRATNAIRQTFRRCFPNPNAENLIHPTLNPKRF